MEHGFLFGTVLFFTIVLGVYSFFTTSILLTVNFVDRYWKKMFFEEQKEKEMAKKNWYRYSSLINENYRQSKVVPGGFEVCPNPSMVTPIKD